MACKRNNILPLGAQRISIIVELSEIHDVTATQSSSTSRVIPAVINARSCRYRPKWPLAKPIWSELRRQRPTSKRVSLFPPHPPSHLVLRAKVQNLCMALLHESPLCPKHQASGVKIERGKPRRDHAANSPIGGGVTLGPPEFIVAGGAGLNGRHRGWRNWSTKQMFVWGAVRKQMAVRSKVSARPLVQA